MKVLEERREGRKEERRFLRCVSNPINQTQENSHSIPHHHHTTTTPLPHHHHSIPYHHHTTTTASQTYFSITNLTTVYDSTHSTPHHNCTITSTPGYDSFAQHNAASLAPVASPPQRRHSSKRQDTTTTP
ncbi:hypothetical protein E2C01_102268 [Portunus trituberculatus]|uniref:Uncharacterized protein n=1 Tax=Portunus trituberculatus TaxID=210409 RepID=A0A5B7KHX7_PORTR|nr:hypothetical protein [Portunus trituberculatus]